jgi:hypothetical protein
MRVPMTAVFILFVCAGAVAGVDSGPGQINLTVFISIRLRAGSIPPLRPTISKVRSVLIPAGHQTEKLPFGELSWSMTGIPPTAVVARSDAERQLRYLGADGQGIVKCRLC